MSECYKCNCEGNFKVEHTKEGEVCIECFQNDKIQSLESELKHVKDLNDSKSEAIQRLEAEIKMRDELAKEIPTI